ncbi:CutC family protein [Apiospora kogelbergensis]|uniref:CutC family protein n=1 Tax=Apiospora kogelbergensis TaxID=1337665 RepID=UPI0031313C3C
MPTHLEVPVFSPASAIPAIAAGAARIELNAAGSYPAGGLTPSVEDAAQLKDVQVPVRVMIRPRGPPGEKGQRDFLYSSEEIAGMARSIEAFKESGAMRAERGDGFVFGTLSAVGTEGGGGGSKVVLQAETMQRLVAAARPYKTVFHRAFDDIVGCDDSSAEDGVTEWGKTLELLIQMGVDGILTSGGPGNASQNIATLSEIMTMAGDSIEIIAGGRVRSANVGELCSQLNMERGGGRTSWVHSSCLTGGKDEVNVAEVQAIMGEIR